MDAGFFLDLVKSIPDGNFPRLYKTIYENPNLDSCKPSLWRAVAEAYKEIGNLDAYKYCLKKADKLAIMVSAWGSFGNKDYIKFFYCLENRPEKGIFLSELKELYPEIQVQNWIGQVDKSATIYIRFEGGYGDVIMFIRYLPLVKKCCKKLIFACHSSLIPLFEENISIILINLFLLFHYYKY